MKRKISAVLAGVMLTASVLGNPASAVCASDFSDVKPGSWYYPAVDFAVSSNLFSGTGNDRFSPDMPMSRGMFATVLAQMYGMEKGYGNDQPSPFVDVKPTDWYYSAAVWANDNGIMAGTGKGFEPNKNVTREQIALILKNCQEKFSFGLVERESSLSTFADASTISSFAQDAMDWAVKYGILGGSNGRLSPKAPASRAQVAVMLKNYSQLSRYRAEEPTPNPEPMASPEAALTWKDYPNRPDSWYNLPEPERSQWEAVVNEWNECRMGKYDETVEYDMPAGKSEPDEDGGYYDYDLANEIMRQINVIREENGLKPLRYNPTVQKWAEIRAKECSVLFDHTRPDGSFALTVGTGLHGENLASGEYSPQRENDYEEWARRLVEGWCNSPGHRANIFTGQYRTAVVSCYVTREEDGSLKLGATHLFSKNSCFYFDYDMYTLGGDPIPNV